ncbi:MAG: family 78 glycoside hydrolase catalytic domain [Firmicutes bacterium]|nr:family 78 glycoside hydrolase catalytic domain [Bacillota bacterium]
MTRPVFSWTVEDAVGTKQDKARLIIREENPINSPRRQVCDTLWQDLNSLACPIDLPLKPRTRYIWNVSIRTDKEGEEAVSDDHYFETSKMDEPWIGKWIGCDDSQERLPIFHKDISVAKEVLSARLYITGLGLYEARMDGLKISDEFLTPYCNDYFDWVQYQTFDITPDLSSLGDHQLDVELGHGWYSGRIGFSGRPEPFFGNSYKLLAEIHIVYKDGTEEVIGTDDSWSVTRSHITFTNIYDGEWRDDTLPDTEPEKVCYVDAPKGNPRTGNGEKEAILTARYSVPVRIYESFPVLELIKTPAGECVLDIGQNIAGIWSLKVNEPEGTKVHLQVGEILQQGNFYNENLRTAKAEYWYTSGGQAVTLMPKFTFYGYRYVKIEIKRPEEDSFHAPEDFQTDSFAAFSLTSDNVQRGFIRTGNELINKLVDNTRWGMMDNFVDVPTDCPQRDERLGWTGDAQVFSPTALYLSDAAAFYTKFLHDMALEQEKWGGLVPNFIPFVDDNPGQAATAWGDAGVIIPWNVYLFSGDTELLKSYYPQMKAWVDYITTFTGDDHNWRKIFHFGDWLALDTPYAGPDAVLGATEEGFIADTYYRRSALLVAKAAKVLGLEEDAAFYTELAEKIRQGLLEEYFSPNGRCCIDTQTAALLNISEGLSVKERGVAMLSKQMKISKGKLKTGFVGTPLLCKVLCDVGMEDLAYGLLLNEDYPGWIYEIKLGATTIWERWNSVLADGSISSTGMNSLNHYAYGSIVEWIFSYCGGLKPAEACPGFKKVQIAPVVNKALSPFEMTYDSAAGEYEVAWTVVDQNHLKVEVTVPFGAGAQITLPLSGKAPFEVGPGHYAYEYETVKPIWQTLSSNTPYEDLMANDKAKKILLDMFPGADQVPAMMRHETLREIMHASGREIPEEAFAALDAALADI